VKKELQRRLSFILSVLAHAVLIAILWLTPKYDASRSLKNHKKSEVVLMDANEFLKVLQAQKQPDGQIVDQDKNAINDEKPEDPKFLSRHNQKVIQQTQAAVHGRFKNTDGTGGQKTYERVPGKVAQKKIGNESDKDQLKNEKADKTTEQKNVLTANDGVGIKKSPSLKDLTPSFKPAPPPLDSASVAQGGGEGPSATDDHLKDIKTGMQTLLSTREFVYYSYYNRIKDKLRQYWEPKIKEKMERIVRQGRTIASTTDRITRIVIILDQSGTLVRVQIVGASGVSDLDDAAVEAFRAAAPFPNPPHGIVDPDGTIKIRWDFVLEANANDFGRGFSDGVRIAQRD